LKLTGIIVAAGSSRRLGGGVNKALRLCQGKALIAHAISALLASKRIHHLVIATRSQDIPLLQKVAAEEIGEKCGFDVVGGGTERQDSVAAALAVVPESSTHVLVHDAARPFTPIAVIERVVTALEEHDAVVPAIAVVDTIKQVSGSIVITTLDRTSLRAIQTPQGFTRTLLTRALAEATADRFLGTDDASLVERLGNTVHWVEGDMANRKVTTPEDNTWLPGPLE